MLLMDGNDRGLNYRKSALHKKWNANKSQYQLQDWDLPGKTGTLKFYDVMDEEV